MTAMSGNDLVQALVRLFCDDDNAGVVRLEYIDDEDATAVIPGLLYELKMAIARTKLPVVVRLYVDIGEIGGQLWNFEVRSMLRFSSSAHPALPRIHDGGVRTLKIGSFERRIAFVVVDREGGDLRHPNALRRVRQQRDRTISQLVMLTDALRLLHASGLSHRNLQPQTIEFMRSDIGDGFKFRLARFETSALEANLLRRASAEPDAAATTYKTLLLSQGRDSLVYLPPERLEALFSKERIRVPPEHKSGDIYGLGVLAFTWFVADIDGHLLMDAFPATGGGVGFSRDGHAALVRWMITRIHTEAGLAPILREVLPEMIKASPFTRLTAAEVVDKLSQHYEDLSAWYGAESERTPYIIAIKPDEFRPTAYRWGWIADDPAQAEGLTALRTFIQDDLFGGTIEYCHGGWATIRGTDDIEERRADIVLHGKRGAYFGHTFEYRLAHEERGEGVKLPQVVFIRQVLDVGGAMYRQYQRPLFRRHLPPVRVFPWNSPYVTPSQARKHPSWVPLMDAIRVESARPENHAAFESALRFLLEVQQVELEARQYAFRRDGPPGSEVTLVFDEDRDEQRRLRRPLLHLFCANADRRPLFGDFFASIVDDGDANKVVTFRSDSGSKPSMAAAESGRAVIAQWEGPHRLRVKVVGDPRPVPSEGWLEPADDGPKRVILERQRIAFRELMDHPALVGQLLEPRALLDGGSMWAGTADAFRVAASSHGPGVKEERTFRELLGERSRDALRELLGCSPFYALQGPPGTGKTTIAARAVRASLLRDPSLRVLISAQSHYALDNFAATVLAYLPEEPHVLAVRIASKSTDEKVDEAVQHLLPKHLSERLAASIRERCDTRQRQHGDSPRIKALLRDWGAEVLDHLPEVVDRVLRGSNLVFSTCGSATEEEVGTSAGLGSFDWVIIEEAAKAWPTELAIPLVRGDRWALIGDQRQLPAYRMREVLGLLSECAAGTEALQVHARQRDAYERAFKLFESCFAHPRSVGGGNNSVRDDGNPDEAPALVRPVNVLNMQFRMAAPIAELVSQFYDEPLQSGPNVDGDHGLPLFQGHSIVWIDTADEVEHRCEPCWYNDGEVEAVRIILDSTRPLEGIPVKAREARLAVLSPYRDQVDRLQANLSAQYRGCVHTIDAFQGREAEVVCVSLVRRRGGHVGTTASSRLGHLVSEQRVNVMLSRARRLLVIVGDMAHFEIRQADAASGASGDFWLKICDTVRRVGHIEAQAAFRRRTYGATKR